MALVVEDGSVVADADSFISLVDARTLAAKYGWELPVDDTAAEVALRNGAQYVDMQEARYSGSRVSIAQTLSWPRVNATNSYSYDIPDDSVPTQAQCGQVAAAAEYGAGTDVRASSDGKNIQSQEVVGAVKQSFFNNGKSSATVQITRALDCLKPLMISSAGNFYNFRVDRG